MPTKKFLKIVGLILLAFFILYFGLMIALGGSKKTATSAWLNAVGQDQSGGLVVGSIDSFQGGTPMAPSSGSGAVYSAEIARGSSVAAKSAPVPDPTAVDKKIIKTGNLNLKVNKADPAAESITNIAKLYKGEVFNLSFSESSRGVKSGYLTVRVPYQNFSAAFAEIKKVASQVLSESSNAQDITAEYIDLEARLKNSKAEEASFVALLNRSGKIEEILAVTREVARVRGEIEQLQGQMRYLSSQTDMSTITVNLSEDAAIVSQSVDWRPWQTFKDSVKQLITNGQNLIDGLISFLIVVLPVLIIYALIIWLIYLIGKKVYRRYFKR